MAGEWRASTWGDEISLEYGKALRGHDTGHGPYRVFGSNGPIGWTVEPLAQGPGVILGRKGAYRGVQFSRDPFFVIDTAYYVVPKTELDMRWLYYAIQHHKLGEVDDGSPIPSTTRAAVYMLDLDVPSHSEQRAIAHILGTLDDKIELNRRMSETLEAMARALFKSWFIDFDPVRRNAARARNQPSPGASRHPLPEGEGHYRSGYDFSGLVEIARELRCKQTPAETLFWELVRNRRFLGLKFRRQHQLGDYVADFYCHEHRLVVELDGGIHAEKPRKDHKRDAWMESQGFTVLRFRNEEILEDPYSALARLAKFTHPSPHGRGAGGEGVVGGEAFDHLFPSRLVDSELGEIPEGWGVKPIGDLAEVVGGSTPKTERAEYWNGGMHHWVTPKDLSGLSMPVLLDTERKITDAGLAQVSSGLLPKGTVLLSSRAPIGYLAIAEVQVAVNQGFIAMKPRPGTSNLFLLRWASAAHDEIVSHANGSTFLEISKAGFRPIRTIAPSGAVMEAFDRLSRPMYRKVVEHERESRTLAALRDTLLPKLISGELRVEDAECIADRAV